MQIPLMICFGVVSGALRAKDEEGLALDPEVTGSESK